jgi:hypothetical protein
MWLALDCCVGLSSVPHAGSPGPFAGLPAQRAGAQMRSRFPMRKQPNGTAGKKVAGTIGQQISNRSRTC